MSCHPTSLSWIIGLRGALLQVAMLGLLAACAQPRPSDYVGGAAGQGIEGIILGKNTSGESCNQLPGDAPNTVAVFCGTWQQPAAHIRADGASTEATPMGVATSGDWRDTINLRFACGTAQTLARANQIAVPLVAAPTRTAATTDDIRGNELAADAGLTSSRQECPVAEMALLQAGVAGQYGSRCQAVPYRRGTIV